MKVRPFSLSPATGIIFILLMAFYVTGCSTATSSPSAPDKKVTLPPPAPVEVRDVPLPLENIKPEPLEQAVEKKGVIFAKSDFQGILKAPYVKLLFEHQNDTDDKFQLNIGEKVEGDASRSVEYGYFFIELPAGPYKISSISIPVGSTLATEDMDLHFTVQPDTFTYLGTLKVTGTKEKIKLGGVPVIRPGFEYIVDIINEKDEAVKTFHERYPQVTQEAVVDLLKTAVK